MRYVKVAAVALNQTPRAIRKNTENIRRGMADAKQTGASVIVFPEAAITGYGCEKAFSFPDLQRRALRALKELEPETKGVVAVVGVPVLFRKALYNCAAVLADGRLLGFVAKRNLAGDGNHYEQRYFRAWKPGTKAEVIIDGKPIPIGDIMFDVAGLRIGVEICEDAWVSNRPGRQMARFGVDLLLSPNASHFSFGKLQTRIDFCRDGSRAFHCGIVYANLLGNEAGPIIYAGEGIIASGGKLLAQGTRLSFRGRTVTTAVIDIAKNRQNQAEQVSFEPEPDDGGMVVPCADFTWPQQQFEPERPNNVQEWERSPEIRFEEFSRVVALGLWDYVRKSKQEGYELSLSGGADSSSVVVLIRDMVELALHEIGVEGIKEAVPGCSWTASLNSSSTVEEITGHMLHSFYQPGEASGDKTLASARAVATGAGARFKVLDIKPLVAQLRGITEDYIERKLSWDNPADDLPLQNFPARARGIVGWSIANAERRLLIPPGNMSEIMVGYFTQGGDDSGGVNPIGGVRKSFLRKWLRWREEQGPQGLPALPFLALVNGLAPTAELRVTAPGEIEQTDEGELGPYEVRDLMEDLFLWDRLTPLEIRDRLLIEYRGLFAKESMTQWVKKFFWLFAVNQWKRERLPVTFHLDDHNLSPRLWLRWPVLSDNFEEELAELELAG